MEFFYPISKHLMTQKDRIRPDPDPDPQHCFLECLSLQNNLMNNFNFFSRGKPGIFREIKLRLFIAQIKWILSGIIKILKSKYCFSK